MVPAIPIAGSPLLPTNIIAAGFLAFLAALVLTYLVVWLKQRTLPLAARLKTVFGVGLCLLILLGAATASLAAFWLLPEPRLIRSQVISQDPVSITQPLVFQFDRPVSRLKLEKIITPDVPGVWVFEDPLYATHFMRRVVFYPDSGLSPGTDYTVSLAGITNTSGLSRTTNQILKFHTVDPPRQATPSSQEALIIPPTPAPALVKLAVPAYLQQHALSCEVSSLRMALAYRGNIVSEDTLLAQVGVDETAHNGNVWGDPYEKFVGNVNGRQMVNGYGVYWGPIARVAGLYRQSEAFEGSTTEKLTAQLKAGNPVLIWVFSNHGISTSWVTPQGRQVYAVRDEHTVVVVGYTGPASDPVQLIVNDPLIGQVYWSRSWFEKKWAIFNRSGVVVH